MNYLAIQTAVIGNRFDSSQLTDIKTWIQTTYTRIWEVEDAWNFKQMGPVALAIVSGNQVPVLPADFADVEDVYDDKGYRLTYFSPEEFDESDLSLAVNATVAKPNAYKLVNGKITVSPKPDAAYTFQLTYERAISSKVAAGTDQLGQMTADTDLPLWDANHHEVIVLGAQVLGLATESDLTGFMLQDQFDRSLAAMQSALVIENPRGITYGRQDPGQYGAYSLAV
jgi:hypothetical protein